MNASRRDHAPAWEAAGVSMCARGGSARPPSGKRLFLTAMTGAVPSTPHSLSVLVGCSSLPLWTTCSQGSLKPSSLRGSWPDSLLSC